MPILFLGDEELIFLHAGWKGLAHHILQNPHIQEIRPYYCFIGPSIHKEAFEVSEDFQDNFPTSPHFFKTQSGFHFDLQNEAKDQIMELFPLIEFEISHECTLSVTKYNSYRRDKTPKRNWNIFSL